MPTYGEPRTFAVERIGVSHLEEPFTPVAELDADSFKKSALCQVRIGGYERSCSHANLYQHRYPR
jgi:hypothetical protein